MGTWGGGEAGMVRVRQMGSLSGDLQSHGVCITPAGGWPKKIWFPSSQLTLEKKKHWNSTTREVLVVGSCPENQSQKKDVGRKSSNSVGEIAHCLYFDRMYSISNSR